MWIMPLFNEMHLCTSKHSAECSETTSKVLISDCCFYLRTADGASVSSVRVYWDERAFEDPVPPFVLLIKTCTPVRKYNAFTKDVTRVLRMNCAGLKYTQPHIHSCIGKLAFSQNRMILTGRRKWDIEFCVTFFSWMWPFGSKAGSFQ